MPLAMSLALAAILSITACRAATPESRWPTAIGIGAVPGAPGYASMVRGVELAVERLRAEGAVFQLRLPRTGTTSAVQVAQQLQADPGVLAVVGHPESGRTLETLPVYADAAHGGADGVVLISPTATSPRLTRSSPWFFRVAPSDADVARFAARWVLDSLGARRAAVIYRNDPYGRDWSDVFTSAFRGEGNIVAREPYLTGVVEWDAFAAQLAVLRPDVILFPGDAEDAIAFRAALADAGVSAPFVGGDGTEAMRQAPSRSPAWFVGFFDAAHATGEEGARFLRRYRERYGEAPDFFAAQSYDAALVIGRTAARGAHTRAALRLALEAVGSRAPAVAGVGGAVAFTPTHDAQPRPLVVVPVPVTRSTP